MRGEVLVGRLRKCWQTKYGKERLLQNGSMTACHQSNKREYKREVTSLSDIDIKNKEINIDSQSDGNSTRD